MSEQILQPMLGMMLLTLGVWVYMYVKRLGHIKRARIDPQELTTAYKAARHFPEEIGYPADNLRNLFELPVLFYAICLYLYVTGSVDDLYVIAAWSFVGLRAVHSAIQCTTNIVMHRFAVYMAGAVVLWFMVLRAAVTALL